MHWQSSFIIQVHNNQSLSMYDSAFGFHYKHFRGLSGEKIMGKLVINDTCCKLKNILTEKIRTFLKLTLYKTSIMTNVLSCLFTIFHDILFLNQDISQIMMFVLFVLLKYFVL